MKKILTVLLILALTFSFVACGSKGGKVDQPAQDVEMKYMTADEAVKVLGTAGYTFLDVRMEADYAEAHITGAVGADMDAAKEGDFEAGVATMKKATEGVSDTLIIICYSGKRYAQATTNVLSAIGYDMSKVYTLEGGFNNWKSIYPDMTETNVPAPEKDIEMKYITADEAVKLVGEAGYLFLDVRKAEDYAAGHIPGAVGADMDAAKEGNFNAGVTTMRKAIEGVDANIILICYSGKRYAQASTNVLYALGYDMTKVCTLEGGFNNWSKVFPDKVEK